MLDSVVHIGDWAKLCKLSIVPALAISTNLQLAGAMAQLLSQQQYGCSHIFVPKYYPHIAIVLLLLVPT